MAANPDRLSFAQFLAWEQRQEGKFEFADGEVIAMWGGTGDHARIADNVRNRLNQHFGVGSPCYAYGSDRKVRVPRPTGDGARYPDATVTCTETDHGKALIIASPVVIVEVVSDSSVSIDTINKLREYTALPTLAQYVLVDSRERWAPALQLAADLRRTIRRNNARRHAAHPNRRRAGGTGWPIRSSR